MDVVNPLPFRLASMSIERRPFLDETLELIATTTILGVVYGIVFILYCLCAWSLYLDFQKPDKRRHASFSFGYTSLLFFCATGTLTFNARVNQLSYIDHADFPGGPFIYLLSHDSTIISCVTTDGILELAIEVLTMAIQVGHLVH